MTDSELLKMAEEVKSGAYAPYSGFKVGAALLTGSGKVYTGINIENISYGATNCAERTAVFKAVSDGEKEIKKIAVASDSKDCIYPCGICRQVIAEFGTNDTRIICSDGKGGYKVYNLDELLPYGFVTFGAGNR